MAFTVSPGTRPGTHACTHSPRCAHRLLCPGRGHPAERRRGRPCPWGAGTPPWTRASGGEEERPALSPEAGTCPSTSPGAGRYPAVKNGPGGRSEGCCSACRHLGVAASPLQLLQSSQSFWVRSAPLAAAEGPCGAWTFGWPGAEEGGTASRGWWTHCGSAQLAIRASRRVFLACSLLALGGLGLSPPSSQRPPAHLRPAGWRALLCSWAEFCVS